MFQRVVASIEAWLSDPARKPLVLRGARQVGKTWLVRQLAERSGRGLVKTTTGQPVSYQLVSVPHYLVWNLAEIVRAA